MITSLNEIKIYWAGLPLLSPGCRRDSITEAFNRTYLALKDIQYTSQNSKIVCNDTVENQLYVNNKEHTLSLINISNMRSFFKMAQLSSCLDRPHTFVVVFDANSRESFTEISEKCYPNIREVFKNVPIILLQTQFIKTESANRVTQNEITTYVSRLNNVQWFNCDLDQPEQILTMIDRAIRPLITRPDKAIIANSRKTRAFIIEALIILQWRRIMLKAGTSFPTEIYGKIAEYVGRDIPQASAIWSAILKNTGKTKNCLLISQGFFASALVPPLMSSQALLPPSQALTPPLTPPAAQSLTPPPAPPLTPPPAPRSANSEKPHGCIVA